MQEGGLEHRPDAAGERAPRAGAERRSGAFARVWAVLSALPFARLTLSSQFFSSSFFFLQTVKAIEQFGAVIEEMLIKHGKKIIGEHQKGEEEEVEEGRLVFGLSSNCLFGCRRAVRAEESG